MSFPLGRSLTNLAQKTHPTARIVPGKLGEVRVGDAAFWSPACLPVEASMRTVADQRSSDSGRTGGRRRVDLMEDFIWAFWELTQEAVNWNELLYLEHFMITEHLVTLFW